MFIPKVYLYNPFPKLRFFFLYPEDVLDVCSPPNLYFLIVMPEPTTSGPNKVSY